MPLRRCQFLLCLLFLLSLFPRSQQGSSRTLFHRASPIKNSPQLEPYDHLLSFEVRNLRRNELNHSFVSVTVNSENYTDEFLASICSERARFFDAGSEVFLLHWIESRCIRPRIVIQVSIPHLPASGTTIHLLYSSAPRSATSPQSSKLLSRLSFDGYFVLFLEHLDVLFVPRRVGRSFRFVSKWNGWEPLSSAFGKFFRIVNGAFLDNLDRSIVETGFRSREGQTHSHSLLSLVEKNVVTDSKDILAERKNRGEIGFFSDSHDFFSREMNVDLLLSEYARSSTPGIQGQPTDLKVPLIYHQTQKSTELPPFRRISVFGSHTLDSLPIGSLGIFNSSESIAKSTNGKWVRFNGFDERFPLGESPDQMRSRMGRVNGFSDFLTGGNESHFHTIHVGMKTGVKDFSVFHLKAGEDESLPLKSSCGGGYVGPLPAAPAVPGHTHSIPMIFNSSVASNMPPHYDLLFGELQSQEYLSSVDDTSLWFLATSKPPIGWEVIDLDLLSIGYAPYLRGSKGTNSFGSRGRVDADHLHTVFVETNREHGSVMCNSVVSIFNPHTHLIKAATSSEKTMPKNLKLVLIRRRRSDTRAFLIEEKYN